MKTKLILTALALALVVADASARCGRRHRGGGCGGQQTSAGHGQYAAPVVYAPACATCAPASIVGQSPVAWSYSAPTACATCGTAPAAYQGPDSGCSGCGQGRWLFRRRR